MLLLIGGVAFGSMLLLSLLIFVHIFYVYSDNPCASGG